MSYNLLFIIYLEDKGYWFKIKYRNFNILTNNSDKLVIRKK